MSNSQKAAEADNLSPCTKKATMACSKHPGKVLDTYCETCQELLCQQCTVETHREHEYGLVGDCFPKHRDAITASLQPVKQQLDTVNQAVGEMDARSRRLAEQTLSTKQKIQDEIDQLCGALETRKQELMTHVDQITKQTEKTLHAQREGYKLTQTELSSCLEYVEESLRTGSQEEILSMEKQVVERVGQMAKEFDPIKFQPEPEQMLQFSHQQLTEACQKFGEIFVAPLCPEKCYATGQCVHGTLKDVVATLTLHTVDTRGQACTDPKAPVTGELVSRGDGGVVKCEVTRKKDNTYELKYQPHTAGEHDLHIKVYDRHIKDSPFTVTVGGFQGIHILTAEGVRFPRHLVTTANGEMIVIEMDANCISVLDRDGYNLGSFGRGSGLSKPRGVTLCSDNTVLVADEYSVKRFTLQGRFIGSVGSDGTDQLQFNQVQAVAFNPTNEKVYVCDTGNHRIQVLNSDLTFSSTFGSRGSDPGQFDSPKGIGVDGTGNIYIADSGNSRIQIFSPSGQFTKEINQRGPEMEGFYSPVSVCVDNQNFIYVLERTACQVSVFNSEGEFIKSFGEEGDGEGEFEYPWAIAVDTAGHIYVSDSGNNRIQIFK